MPKLISLWILSFPNFLIATATANKTHWKNAPWGEVLEHTTGEDCKFQWLQTINAGSQHVIFFLDMDIEWEITYRVGIDRNRAISLCVKIILYQVEIKANVLSPYLLLKLRDVEISEIKFTAALVASNKNLFLILQKQKKKKECFSLWKKRRGWTSKQWEKQGCSGASSKNNWNHGPKYDENHLPLCCLSASFHTLTSFCLTAHQPSPCVQVDVCPKLLNVTISAAGKILPVLLFLVWHSKILLWGVTAQTQGCHSPHKQCKFQQFSHRWA